MNFLLVFIHPIPVVPEPIVLSNTVSNSFEYVLIKYSINNTGFCVSCIVSYSISNSIS